MRKSKQTSVKKVSNGISSRTTSTSAPLVMDTRFHSAALSREMTYRIYLPHNYLKTTRRYPVLYLLHGVYGGFENWDTLTNLATYVAGLDWIIVMPDADDSWYTNSATSPGERFEDYIVKDVIAEVDSKHRTIRDRHARAVAGLSMGGYAALKFSLRDPSLFGFAASLSGAVSAGRDLDAHAPDLAAKLVEVFGAPGNPTRANNNIFLLLQKAGLGELPYFYLACGIEDTFLAANREFVAELSCRNLPYEYHETPGGHGWDYWDRGIKPLLSQMTKQLP